MTQSAHMPICYPMVRRTRITRYRPEPCDVRRALNVLMSECDAMLPPNCAEVAGNLQIVLAEALNNVAEHAFDGLEPSEASVAIALRGDHLRVVLRDTGHPLPQRLLQPPPPPNLAGETDVLPEGGFGWALIHQLTSRLEYSRTDRENRLSLWFLVAGTRKKLLAPQ